MTFAGLDLHKKEVEAALVDHQGNLLHRSRFPATREALEAFAGQHLSGTTAVAVEATTNTWPVATILQPLVQKLVVSNPLRTKAIASAKIKTDKVDALTLAQLLRTGYLPEVCRFPLNRFTDSKPLSAYDPSGEPGATTGGVIPLSIGFGPAVWPGPNVSIERSRRGRPRRHRRGAYFVSCREEGK